MIAAIDEFSRIHSQFRQNLKSNGINKFCLLPGQKVCRDWTVSNTFYITLGASLLLKQYTVGSYR